MLMQLIPVQQVSAESTIPDTILYKADTPATDENPIFSDNFDYLLRMDTLMDETDVLTKAEEPEITDISDYSSNADFVPSSEVTFTEAENMMRSGNTEAVLSDTIKYNVDIITEAKNEDGTDKLEYFSGETIMPRATFDISGDGVNIANAKTVITVPKVKYNGKQVVTKPTFVILDSAKTNVMTEDEDNWYYTYTFESLKGGSVALAPFPFSFINKVTPGGTTITPRYELFDGDGKLLDSKEVTYTSKVQGYENRKFFWTQGRPERTSIETGTKATAIRMEFKNSKAPETTPAEGYDVTFHMQISPESNNNNQGIFDLEGTIIRIVDKLPVGATVSQKSLDDGWVYDKDTHTAIWEGVDKWGYRSKDQWTRYYGWGKSITLNFANYPMYINNGNVNQTSDKYIFENTASFTVSPGSEHEINFEDKTVRGLFEAYETIYKPAEAFYFDMRGATGNSFGTGHWNNIYEIANNDITKNGNNSKSVFFNGSIYRVHTGTSGDLNDTAGGSSYQLSKVHFVELDSRLHYEYFKPTIEKSTQAIAGKPVIISGELGEKFNNTNNTLYGVKVDGTKVPLAENVKIEQKVEIKDTNREYVSLEFAFEKPLELYNDDLRFNVEGYPNADELEKFKNKEYDVAQRYNQRMELTGKLSYQTDEIHLNHTKERDRNNNFTQIDYPRPTVYFKWADWNHIVPYGANNTREIQIGSELNGTWNGLDPNVKNVKLITLLPAGIEFHHHKKATYTNSDVNQIQPEIVPNFNGTGKTAVIYTFNNKAVNEELHYLNDRYSLMNYYVDVTKYTAPGLNTLEHYVVWENNDLIKPWDKNQAYTDSLDLDGDGDKDEVFLKKTTTITFLPPEEILGKKQVALNLDGEWSLEAPPQDFGGDVYFKLSILNNTLFAIDKLSIIDVFPYIGDHVIVPNNEGIYLPRGSEFSTPLTMAIEDVVDKDGNKVNAKMLERFDVFYSLTKQGADLASVRDSQWLTKDEISDFKKVQNIKFVLKDGAKINAKEEISFITKNQVPTDDLTLENFKKANNTIAFSRNGVDYLEANRAVVSNVKYTVDGCVFADLNENSEINLEASEGERADILLEGYKLKLMNADGTPATDLSGNEITAVSDKDGKYSMNVYKRGEYYVRMEKKSDQKITKLSAEVGVNGNDATEDAEDAGNAKTAIFTLLPNTDSTRHGRRNFGLLISWGDLTVEKVDENGEKLEGVKFDLFNGEKLIKSDLTTDKDGKLFVEKLEFGKYKLVEKSTLAKYVLDQEATEFEISPDELNIKKIVENKIKRGSVTLTKKDDLGNVLKGVTFVLKQGDEVKYEATTDANGQITFTDVLYGEYVLEETKTLDSHRLLTETTKVVIDEDKKVVAIGDITNEIKRGTVSVTKVDAENNEIKLEGVVFALKQNGEEKFTAVTNSDGVATFTALPYGTYELSEKEGLANYLVSTETREVNIDADNKDIDLGNFTNQIIKGTIRVEKVDKDNPNKKLAGVVFGLFKDDVEIDRKTTDNNGLVEFENVIYGNYTIKELKALPNYILNREVLNAQISEDGQVITFEKFTNEFDPPTYNNIIIPNIIPSTPTTPNKPNVPTIPTIPTVPDATEVVEEPVIDETANDDKSEVVSDEDVKEKEDGIFDIPKTGDANGAEIFLFGLSVISILLLLALKKRSRNN